MCNSSRKNGVYWSFCFLVVFLGGVSHSFLGSFLFFLHGLCFFLFFPSFFHSFFFLEGLLGVFISMSMMHMNFTLKIGGLT